MKSKLIYWLFLRWVWKFGNFLMDKGHRLVEVGFGYWLEMEIKRVNKEGE